MNKKRVGLLAFILLVTVSTSGCGYNTLQGKQQQVKNKWANIETQLQRRADLIPNLFEAAKAAGIQEQEVFGQIAEARSRLLNATSAQPQGEAGDKTPEQKQAVIEANNSFGGTIGRLLSLTEAYPQLRSNENFLKFQDSLEGTESRIAVARTDYNNVVTDYNTARGQFPMVIAAKIYGFKEEPLFTADPSARQAPTINSESLRRNSGGATTNTNR
ncbi:MAG TPA: LemA family protein [Pyrinomonadaceae bacterium]